MNRKGAAAIIAGAGIWGLFWLPLRILDENGIHGLWAVAIVMLFALVPAATSVLIRGGISRSSTRGAAKVGITIGASSVLYFVAVLYSDVIRVIFLFYLLPIWATLAARFLFGEPIGKRRQLVIVIALIGVWQLLGGDGGIPLPRNIGDWCGIGAGMLWGLSLALIRDDKDGDPFASSAAPFLFGALFAIIAAVMLAILFPSPLNRFPQTTDLLVALPLAAIFGMIVLWPSMLGQVWGAQLVPAPSAALLTMTEILVATISAYFLIGTDLTFRSLIGGLIIIIAVVLDISGEKISGSQKP